LKKLEQEKQTILNAQELSNRNAINKQREYYQEYLENKKKDIVLLKKSVEKRVSY